MNHLSALLDYFNINLDLLKAKRVDVGSLVRRADGLYKKEGEGEFKKVSEGKHYEVRHVITSSGKEYHTTRQVANHNLSKFFSEPEKQKQYEEKLKSLKSYVTPEGKEIFYSTDSSLSPTRGVGLGGLAEFKLHPDEIKFREKLLGKKKSEPVDEKEYFEDANSRNMKDPLRQIFTRRVRGGVDMESLPPPHTTEAYSHLEVRPDTKEQAHIEGETDRGGQLVKKLEEEKKERLFNETRKIAQKVVEGINEKSTLSDLKRKVQLLYSLNNNRANGELFKDDPSLKVTLSTGQVTTVTLSDFKKRVESSKVDDSLPLHMKKVEFENLGEYSKK